MVGNVARDGAMRKGAKPRAWCRGRKPTPEEPVLIHGNGVTEDVVDSEYFAHIVDMSELLL